MTCQYKRMGPWRGEKWLSRQAMKGDVSKNMLASRVSEDDNPDCVPGQNDACCNVNLT